jgi:multidrug efflux pump subunit AcrA (membrane-fusion protein)
LYLFDIIQCFDFKDEFMNVPQRISSLFNRIFRAFTRFIDTHPFVAFLGLIGVLIGLVVVGNTMRKVPPQVVSDEPIIKQIEAYHIGEAPKLKLQAVIDKSGIINIVAQSPGVVQKITVKEGTHVKRGSRIVNLSTNYQGGNTASLGRQISQKNFVFLKENIDEQKDLLNTQREVARKVDTQSDELRSISRKSLDDTKSLITLDEDIMNSIQKQIEYLESVNVNGATDSALLAAKQGKAQVLGALSGLRSTVRTVEYTSADDKEGAQLSDLQRDATLKQLDLQEKTLELNKDISKLNLRISQVNEALMYPAAPSPGTVERVYVKVGQVVNPGTLIATIRGDKNDATAVLLASEEVASKISQLEPSTIKNGNTLVSIYPRYISKEPTNGTLHSILFAIPTEIADKFTNNSTVQVEVPIGYANTTSTIPYIPLDAIYQTQDRSYIYIVGANDKGEPIAKVSEVKIGQVYGSYVEVLEGLKQGDQVITNRNVIEGDRINIDTSKVWVE